MVGGRCGGLAGGCAGGVCVRAMWHGSLDFTICVDGPCAMHTVVLYVRTYVHVLCVILFRRVIPFERT